MRLCHRHIQTFIAVGTRPQKTSEGCSGLFTQCGDAASTFNIDGEARMSDVAPFLTDLGHGIASQN